MIMDFIWNLAGESCIINEARIEIPQLHKMQVYARSIWLGISSTLRLPRMFSELQADIRTHLMIPTLAGLHTIGS
jgi:hypothetical protein